MLTTSPISNRISENQEQFKKILDQNQSLLRNISSYTFNVKYYGGKEADQESLFDLIRLNIQDKETFSLYFHYPYCQYLCSFCHYPVAKLPTDSDVANINMVNYLILHLDVLLKNFPRLHEMSVTSIYLGGGTPSLLSGDDLQRFTQAVKHRVKTTSSTEWTIEASPDSLVRSGLDYLLKSGFNRISTGIQILSDTSLQKFHREHSVSESIQVLDLFKEYRTSNVTFNVDLMYGLPNVESITFWDNVRVVAGYGIDSITLYRLRLGRSEERLAGLYHEYINGDDQYPDQLQTLLQIDVARSILQHEFEYTESPLGWFHKRCEDQVYKDRWLDQNPMFGLGLASYSYGKNWQLFNHKKLNIYQESIKKSVLPYGQGFYFNEEEAILREIAFRMRYTGEIQLVDILDQKQKVAKKISSALSSMKLGEEADNSFKLNDFGKAFIDEIIDVFCQTNTSRLSS